jgi:disabled family protein 2
VLHFFVFFVLIHLASVASYTKMAEIPSSRPSSPPPASPPPTPGVKEGESKSKKYEGDGAPFKGKLIGMEDLTIDRDEKVCLEAMFKLKAVVRARGEHKQRIQLNLTMSAVKVIDDTTKVC